MAYRVRISWVYVLMGFREAWDVAGRCHLFVAVRRGRFAFRAFQARRRPADVNGLFWSVCVEVRIENGSWSGQPDQRTPTRRILSDIFFLIWPARPAAFYRVLATPMAISRRPPLFLSVLPL
jgi:hypothetical protein